MLLFAASTAEMPQRAAKAELVVSKLREWRMAFEANVLQADEQEVDEDFLDTDQRPVEGMVDGGGLVDTVREAAEVDAWVNDIADEREKKRFRLNDWVRTAAHAAALTDVLAHILVGGRLLRRKKASVGGRLLQRAGQAAGHRATATVVEAAAPQMSRRHEGRLP